jgi:hypothetical protein
VKNIPQEWRAYASKQEQLNRRSSADSTAWGLEAGLNALLSGSATPDTVDRAIANTSRRSRYAQSLLAKYIRIGGSFDGLGHLEARSTLTLIADRLSNPQIMLLLASLSEDRMCGTDRTRLSRARATARRLAA